MIHFFSYDSFIFYDLSIIHLFSHDPLLYIRFSFIFISDLHTRFISCPYDSFLNIWLNKDVVLKCMWFISFHMIHFSYTWFISLYLVHFSTRVSFIITCVLRMWFISSHMILFFFFFLHPIHFFIADSCHCTWLTYVYM